MFKPANRFAEIVSLSVMLLLIAALVASQADAGHSDDARTAIPVEQLQDAKEANTPFETTIRAHIIGQPLTISVEPVSRFGSLRFIFN